MRTNRWGTVLSVLMLFLLVGCGNATSPSRGSGSTVVAASAALPSPGVGTYAGPQSHSSEFRWTRVGGDPCNPAVGCTLEWAMQQSGWPIDVQQEMLRAVREQGGERFDVVPGMRFWGTWGKYTRKFHPNVRAAFGQPTPALRWRVVRSQRQFVAAKVFACGNWIGFDEDPQPAVSTPPPAIPQVACP